MRWLFRIAVLLGFAILSLVMPVKAQDVSYFQPVVADLPYPVAYRVRAQYRQPAPYVGMYTVLHDYWMVMDGQHFRFAPDFNFDVSGESFPEHNGTWSPDCTRFGYVGIDTQTGFPSFAYYDITNQETSESYQFQGTRYFPTHVDGWSFDGRYVALSGGMYEAVLILDLLTGDATVRGWGRYDSWQFAGWGADSDTFYMRGAMGRPGTFEQTDILYRLRLSDWSYQEVIRGLEPFTLGFSASGDYIGYLITNDVYEPGWYYFRNDQPIDRLEIDTGYEFGVRFRWSSDETMIAYGNERFTSIRSIQVSASGDVELGDVVTIGGRFMGWLDDEAGVLIESRYRLITQEGYGADLYTVTLDGTQHAIIGKQRPYKDAWHIIWAPCP